MKWIQTRMGNWKWDSSQCSAGPNAKRVYTTEKHSHSKDLPNWLWNVIYGNWPRLWKHTSVWLNGETKYLRACISKEAEEALAPGNSLYCLFHYNYAPIWRVNFFVFDCVIEGLDLHVFSLLCWKGCLLCFSFPLNWCVTLHGLFYWIDVFCCVEYI
jgi:hypothetical protein